MWTLTSSGSRSRDQDQVSLWNRPDLSMAVSICAASSADTPPFCWNTSFRASHTLVGISLALLHRKQKQGQPCAFTGTQCLYCPVLTPQTEDQGCSTCRHHKKWLVYFCSLCDEVSVTQLRESTCGGMKEMEVRKGGIS